MSDTALNKIIQYGARANRIAFTPSPASGSQVLYLWYETDHAPDTWAWDGSAWQQINTAGSGTVTTTGSPASGNLSKFSGATSITNGDLSGDVATSGTLATTIQANAVTTSKINASAVTLAKIANASANSVLVGSGSAGSGSAYSEIALGTGLSMSGTTLSSTGGSAGFVLVEQHTASTSAALNFTTGITSSYDEYRIELVNLLPTTSGLGFFLQFSTDGGSTYDTATNYGWAGFRSSAAGSASAGANGTSFIDLSAGGNQTNSTSVQPFSGSLTLTGPAATAWKTVFGMTAADDGTGNPQVISMLNGIYSGAAVNAFRIFSGVVGTNTIASGTVRLYGLAK